MAGKETIRCQIYCQKGKEMAVELPRDTGIYEKDGVRIQVQEVREDGCRLGTFRLDMKNEACRDNANLRMEKPIRLYLPISERPEKITAMYLYNEWWTRPAFVESFQEIPDNTQAAFFRYKDCCACIILLAGREFKTCMAGGTENEVRLELFSCLGGQQSVDEPLYLWAEAPELPEAIHKAFAWIAEYKGIRLRKERRLPEMFRYLGWCSWDACYTDVTEEKIRQKAEELMEKKVPVKWMLIDDGWLSAKEELLYGFEPDKEKFPHGFKHMVKEIREKGAIRWFGVWHALGGYWGGIQPGSRLEAEEGPYLYRTVNGKLLPSPAAGGRFYQDWYRKLREEGIDFVKVDGQSAIPYYFENSLPVSEAARGMAQALEGGAFYMDGAIINCMGMAMESILARPVSAISRNSDDFVPGKENGFAEHLLQNAYNALYHNEIYCCDWDMFWTRHEDCVKHSLLRAISGGPVYFSDKVGDTAPEVLKPLAYADGRLLMMERSAKPTKDSIFSDPMANGVLKLHNAAPWGADGKGGGIAVYNLTKQPQAFSFSPKDIPEMDGVGKYWVYDFFGKKAALLDGDGRYEGVAEENGFAWFVVLPHKKAGSCLGLLDKYVGFTAVESICEKESTQVIVARESGPLGWLSEKEPKKVEVDSVDVTETVQKKGMLYVIPLPECPSKTVVSVAI